MCYVSYSPKHSQTLADMRADVTHRDVNSPIKASSNNFDNLDKAFVIFKLPGEGRLHRRVDLISAPKQRYAAAVLSWSGSMMFERDLR
jgi:DNA polymerase mu